MPNRKLSDYNWPHDSRKWLTFIRVSNSWVEKWNQIFSPSQNWINFFHRLIHETSKHSQLIFMIMFLYCIIMIAGGMVMIRLQIVEFSPPYLNHWNVYFVHLILFLCFLYHVADTRWKWFDDFDCASLWIICCTHFGVYYLWAWWSSNRSIWRYWLCNWTV